jgi:hypothetical protein
MPKIHDNSAIAAAQDYPISLTYTGPQLTPCHATAWQALVAIAFARNRGTAMPLDVSLIDLLRAMGRTSVQTNAKRWLRALLKELELAWISVNTPRQSFLGALISCIDPLARGRLRIRFAPGLDQFLADEVVLMPMASKGALSSYPLAAWLHDYIATHQSVYEIPMQTLHTLCGSTLSIPSFRSRIRQALTAVMASGPLLPSCSIGKDRVVLRKQKTRVLLLRPDAAKARRALSKHEAAIQDARKWRARVPL